MACGADVASEANLPAYLRRSGGRGSRLDRWPRRADGVGRRDDGVAGWMCWPRDRQPGAADGGPGERRRSAELRSPDMSGVRDRLRLAALIHDRTWLRPALARSTARCG
ncbi:hypothetical protein GCM10027569_71220 [Flindersiella endophytica]